MGSLAVCVEVAVYLSVSHSVEELISGCKLLLCHETRLPSVKIGFFVSHEKGVCEVEI